MGAIKVWDGTAWQTASAQGPTGPMATPAVTSVDGRTGAVVLSDLYASRAQLIQYVGVRAITTDAGAYIFLTFPTPFQSSEVAVGVTNATPGEPLALIVQHTNLTANGFVLQAWRINGTPATNVAIAFMYTAVGVRP
jgi:hypothetical protein